MLKAKDTTRKCFPKKKGYRAENRKFFVKFQAKKKGHDLGPLLTNQKNCAVLKGVRRGG